MQRPNKEDFVEIVEIEAGKMRIFKKADYEEAMEKYCDKLEDKNKTQHEVIELSKAVITELERRNAELERKNEALDKRCDELERKKEMCEKEVFAITQRVIKLERAFDKACSVIEKFTKEQCIGFCDTCSLKQYCTKGTVHIKEDILEEVYKDGED